MSDALLAQSSILSAEYTNVNNVHPLGVVGLVVAAIGVFMVKPSHALVVALLFSWVVVPSQRVIVGGIDFSFYRLIGLVLLFRIAAFGQWSWNRPHAVDYAIVFLCAIQVLATAVRSGSVVNSIGTAGDFLLYYGLGRVCITNLQTWRVFIKPFAVATVAVCIPLTIEKFTGRNFLALFGGVPEITLVRDGKLRAQAAFVHPIIAGVILAGLVPVFLSLRRKASSIDGSLFVFGAAAGVYATLLTSSSTPLGSLLFGILVFAVFTRRAAVPWVVTGFVLLGLFLHVFSASGLHHILFARTTFVAGSTGWHRYLLWDAAISRFGDWAAVGVNSTADWGRGLQDVTCQYIAAGVRGGLLALGALLVALGISARSCWRKSLGPSLVENRIYWGMFAWLAANAVAFIAVTYFGQGTTMFAAILGAISSIAVASPVAHRAIADSKSAQSVEATVAEGGT